MTKRYDTNEKINDSDKDLLADIRSNFKLASETFSKQRTEAAEDFRFRAGDQWDSKIKIQRELEGRPCLAVNKLGQFIRQIVNSQKINRPSININPGDSAAKIEVARVFQAIVKNIELQSMAENAYDTAFDNTCTCGEGYFRIITEYAPMSFEQDIFIRAIDNPFSVYIDPSFKSDFSDINWAFVHTDLAKEEFERLYPDSDVCKGEAFISNNDWIREDTVRLTEYFYIDYEKVMIVLLKNGEVMVKSEYEALSDEAKASTKVIKEREHDKKIVRWVKTNGYEILESTIFPGTIIPIIPVFADTYIVEGKRVFEGIVRQAKDPQRAYNFWTSAEAELIALSPKAPFVGAAGQFEGFEAKWANANRANIPFLEYNPVAGVGGTPLPPPQRQQFDPAIGTVIQAKQTANEDLKSTTGIYDPSLGTDKKESSGVALITKQRQAEVTNFMYIDNLAKSLKYAGKILLGIIPEIYDTKRVVRIIGGVNQEDELVIINSFDEKDPIFLNVGKYDCDVSIGPYGENQRQEAIESMLSLMQINPQLSGLIGDIFVAKQDWEGAKEVSERLKIMLPPALQGQQELPPELQAQLASKQQEYEQKIMQDQAQMQQMQELIANLTSQLNKNTAALNNKQADIESKERIAAMNARVQLAIAGLKEDSADSRLAFQQELAHTAMQQVDPEDDIPEQGDEYVLSGVNDPITEAHQTEHGISPEETDKLLAKLQNMTPVTTQM